MDQSQPQTAEYLATLHAAISEILAELQRMRYRIDRLEDPTNFSRRVLHELQVVLAIALQSGSKPGEPPA